MISNNTLIVFFEGVHRNFLMGIRNQEKSRDEYLEILKERLLKVNNNLPYQSDFSQLNEWLIKIKSSKN